MYLLKKEKLLWFEKCRPLNHLFVLANANLWSRCHPFSSSKRPNRNRLKGMEWNIVNDRSKNRKSIRTNDCDASAGSKFVVVLSPKRHFTFFFRSFCINLFSSCFVQTHTKTHVTLNVFISSILSLWYNFQAAKKSLSKIRSRCTVLVLFLFSVSFSKFGKKGNGGYKKHFAAVSLCFDTLHDSHVQEKHFLRKMFS